MDPTKLLGGGADSHAPGAAGQAPHLTHLGPDLSDPMAGFYGFADGKQILDMVVVFLIATLLGAAIAYHPRTRAKASTLTELEQPKTFIFYALVGAVIAKIVEANSSMALVVFGIGGLMRFRTDVGPAKDTGRVILTAVVGVCCGLNLYVPAVTATAFGWILIWGLERQTFTRLLVKGVAAEHMTAASEAYRKLLLEASCRLFGERKKVTEGQIAFVFSTPPSFDRERFENQANAVVQPPLRGALDWDLN